jgi:hypothetical protein
VPRREAWDSYPRPHLPKSPVLQIEGVHENAWPGKLQKFQGEAVGNPFLVGLLTEYLDARSRLTSRSAQEQTPAGMSSRIRQDTARPPGEASLVRERARADAMLRRLERKGASIRNGRLALTGLGLVLAALSAILALVLAAQDYRVVGGIVSAVVACAAGTASLLTVKKESTAFRLANRWRILRDDLDARGEDMEHERLGDESAAVEFRRLRELRQTLEDTELPIGTKGS